MKKIILGFGLVAFSFACFIPQDSMATEDPCKDGSCQNANYYAMSQSPSTGEMCCQKTTNELNSCTGEVC